MRTPARLLPVLLVLLTPALASATWPLGAWGGRTLQRLEIPGATCGNGTPYAVFFSQAPVATDKRVTVYFSGGGSTKCLEDANPCPSESVESSMRNLDGLDGRLGVGATTNVTERMFIDHSDNDEFIGPGHWLVLPYCTQDMHSGRRTDVQTYDMTDVSAHDPNNVLVAQVEGLLNGGSTVAEIEADHPGIEIAAVSGGPGSFQVDQLLVHVTHRGDDNVATALSWFATQANGIAPDFFDGAQVLVTGGSAGGFGAWHQFWRLGDFLDDKPGTSLTLAPMAGSPVERWYSEEAGGLVKSPSLVQEIDRRWTFYQGQRPCEIAGGDHAPAASDDCDDILDLLDHYRVQRYPGRDIRYMPMGNKEDFVAIHVIYGTDPDTVLGFCRTVQRYFQYLARVPDTHPYATWLFFQEDGGAPQREHTPDRATMLMEIQQPDGAGAPSAFSQLRFMNALSGRTLADDTVHIEHVPVVVDDIDDPNSTFSLGTTHFTYPDCNVPRPVGVETKKLEMRDDVTPPVLAKRRSFKFTASTKKAPELNRVVSPAPGTDGDPTLHGATLSVVNTAGTGETFTIDLDAGSWSMLGSSSSPKGWKWKPSDPSSAVSLVKVKDDLIKVKAGDEAFAYTLDEPSQGSVGMRLTLGTGWLFCADVPARTKGDPPSSEKYDKPEKFSGEKKSAGPTLCPLLEDYACSPSAAGSMRVCDEGAEGPLGDSAVLLGFSIQEPDREDDFGFTIDQHPTVGPRWMALPREFVRFPAGSDSYTIASGDPKMDYFFDTFLPKYPGLLNDQTWPPQILLPELLTWIEPPHDDVQRITLGNEPPIHPTEFPTAASYVTWASGIVAAAPAAITDKFWIQSGKPEFIRYSIPGPAGLIRHQEMLDAASAAVAAGDLPARIVTTHKLLDEYPVPDRLAFYRELVADYESYFPGVELCFQEYKYRDEPHASLRSVLRVAEFLLVMSRLRYELGDTISGGAYQQGFASGTNNLIGLDDPDTPEWTPTEITDLWELFGNTLAAGTYVQSSSAGRPDEVQAELFRLGGDLYLLFANNGDADAAFTLAPGTTPGPVEIIDEATGSLAFRTETWSGVIPARSAGRVRLD